MKPLTILIRTSFRPVQFKKAYDSIPHELCNVIVCYDKDLALEYIPEGVEKFKVYRTTKPYFYNTYCNELKDRVKVGWFMFLDDDDTIIPGSLERVVRQLTFNGGIVPFLRNGVQKPSRSKMKARLVQEGHIGMPCIILNAAHKDVGSICAMLSGDYEYIRQCNSLIELKWIDIPVVSSECRNNGKMESSYSQFIQKA